MEFIIDQLVTWWQFTVVGILIIIGLIVNIFGVDCKEKIIGFEYKEMPKDDPKQRKPSIELAKKILNWEPKIELKEGLMKTIEWFKYNL